MCPRRGTALALLLGACGPALAHGGFANVQPFWSGALHLLLSPLSVAAVIGLVAALPRTAAALPVPAIALGAGAAFVAAGLGLPVVATAAPIGVIVLGLVAAAARPLPRWADAVLAVLAGLTAGGAAELDAPGWTAGAGVALTMAYGVVCGVAGLAALQRRPALATPVTLARRIAGAWVAALGLLLAALVFVKR